MYASAEHRSNRKFLTGSIIIAVSLFCLGCSSSEELAKEHAMQIIRSSSRPVKQEEADSHIIRRGDQIQLSVWGYPEFTVAGPVKESGIIAIPLLGDLNAAGFTKAEFTELLKRRLSEYIQGEVKLSLSVVSTVAQKVSVLGAVMRQESYPLMFDAPLMEILSMAGGPSPEADLRHIKILRGVISQQPVDIDLSSHIESGDLESIPIVRPGDTVFIPKRENLMRELSDFMRDAIFIFGFFRVFN